MSTQALELTFTFVQAQVQMRNLSGDVNGGMVSVLSSALEADGDPLIRFHMTQIIPAFPIIVYENCKRGFCGGTIWLGYFAPIGTTIFKHTLGSGRCKGASGGCWCECGLLFNSCYCIGLLMSFLWSLMVPWNFCCSAGPPSAHMENSTL